MGKFIEAGSTNEPLAPVAAIVGVVTVLELENSTAALPVPVLINET
jgi:hypothetical protein